MNTDKDVTYQALPFTRYKISFRKKDLHDMDGKGWHIQLLISIITRKMDGSVRYYRYWLTNRQKKISIIICSRVLQGVQEKLCFFTIHCNHSLAYIAVRDLQSSQRNVYHHPYLLIECWRGRGGKIARILEKNTIFYEHPADGIPPLSFSNSFVLY